MSSLSGQIEGILFAWSEPLTIRDITEVLGVTKKEVEQILGNLKKEYERDSRGLRLVIVNDTYQLSTKPEDYDIIQQFFAKKKKKQLSNAGLETLSIIAYRQLVTKIEIEEIRGVNCDSIIRTLMDIGYIESAGKLDKPGKPILYKTTNIFLNKFGLENLKELPPVDTSGEEEIATLNF